ncbi:spermatogenesis-associated protein 31E1-like isoform X1 [Equus przewalskii]|uniref:Spermatogenesis-associated protein 31E1-like isoform X1 n=2 Tax=Equus przewalskii TaxID=9798 RepID=A0ABM4LRN0_EQUPR
METPILDLKSIVATWLSSSSASWVIGTILRILYGLGLFLLFFPCPKRNLPSQLTYKRRNVRKHQVEPRGRSSRSRKKRGALKAYRAGQKDPAEMGGLMPLSQSSPGRLSCKGCFHRLSSRDSPGEACKAASAGVRQQCRKPVEGAPLSMTPALSLALLTQRTLPLASTLPAEPSSDLTRTPLSPVATSSAPGHSHWPFPNSGHGRMSCHIEFLSRWNMIEVLFFPVSSHFESQQGHLSCHRPVASLWGGPTNREGETDSPSVANPEVPKPLETEITESIQTEVWEKEPDDPGTPQMLEAHGIMSGLNFRWGLPLLSLEPADLKACEAQPSALPRSPLPPAATCDSGAPSKAYFTHFMGKPLEPPPGDQVLTLTTKPSVPRLARPLPAPSPVCEEDQKALGGALPGEGSGPSEASLLGQEGRLPSPTFPFSLSERKGQSGTFVGAEQGRGELSSGSPVARNEPREETRGGASAEPCRGVATLEGESWSQSGSQVGGIGDTLGTKPLQPLREKEEVFHDSPFRKMLRRLLPCLRPNKEEAPEDPLAKASPRQPPPRARHGSHIGRRRMAGLFRRHRQ